MEVLSLYFLIQTGNSVGISSSYKKSINQSIISLACFFLNLNSFFYSLSHSLYLYLSIFYLFTYLLIRYFNNRQIRCDESKKNGMSKQGLKFYRKKNQSCAISFIFHSLTIHTKTIIFKKNESKELFYSLFYYLIIHLTILPTYLLLLQKKNKQKQQQTPNAKKKVINMNSSTTRCATLNKTTMINNRYVRNTHTHLHT